MQLEHTRINTSEKLRERGRLWSENDEWISII